VAETLDGVCSLLAEFNDELAEKLRFAFVNGKVWSGGLGHICSIYSIDGANEPLWIKD
jgi:hypothetical protein